MPAPLVFAGLATASVLSQIVSANAQAKAIKASAEFAAKIAELNAQRAEIDMVQAVRDGRTAEARYLTQTQQVDDATTAAFAEQGVEVKGDATGDLVAQSRLNAALNVIDIQNAAFQNASRYKREAEQIRTNAAIGLFNADQESQATTIAGYTRALGSAAQFGLQGYSLYGGGGSGELQTTSSAIPSRLAPKPALELTNELGLFAGHDHWNNYYS